MLTHRESAVCFGKVGRGFAVDGRFERLDCWWVAPDGNVWGATYIVAGGSGFRRAGVHFAHKG